MKGNEIGSEPTLREFIDKLTDVFELCRELLADDGTAWVNMGDSYCSTAPGTNGDALRREGIFAGVKEETAEARRKYRPKTPEGLKPKDLCGQPWRLAFALQDAGWYLRQDIIWHKPNPMPESTRDRCTKAHEYVFLLSKNSRYFYDQVAIRTPASAKTTQLSYDTFDGDRRAGYKMPDGWNTAAGGHGSFHPEGREKGRSARDTFKREDSKRAAAHPGQTTGTHRPDRADSEYDLSTANRRSVWTIATEAYPGAHFATFPEALVEPCVLAGSRTGDIVFDPFFGSGTTGSVASRLGRKWIGCELNSANEELQHDRLRQPGLMLEQA